MLGVAVATMAMVVTLSVFNGFQDLVADLFTAFDPELRVSPRNGQTVSDRDSALLLLKANSAVEVYTPVLEGQALVVQDGRQQVVTIRGVADNITQQGHIEEILYGDGSFCLHADVLEYGVLGIQLAQQLGLPAFFENPLQVYAPKQGERVNIEFDIPSRGIIGLRTNVLTASQGEAIMAHRFKEYQPYKGEIERRVNGSMISMDTGNAFAYAIDKLQDRGKFFIDPGEDVYMGQVVGEHVHDNDLVVNVCKAKQLTNVRASGTDDKARIIPKTVMSLEECLEYIKSDELVEVTPKSMRMRKTILDHDQRKKAAKQ